jgi:hypothetical protein
MDDVPIPSVDDELGVGTTISGLTPALPISTEPNGIPVRVAPEGDGDHIAEDDDPVPPVPQIAVVAALLDTVVPPSIPAPVVVPVPAGAPMPVLNALVPTPNPPPSKVVLVPEPCVAARATAEQVLPKPGKVIVPVGAGESPGAASSVAPKGIPVGWTDAPGVMPSGEVAPMPGVGMPTPPTCATAGPQPNSTASIAVVNRRSIMISIPNDAVPPRLRIDCAALSDLTSRRLLGLAGFVARLLRCHLGDRPMTRLRPLNCRSAN